MEEVGEEVDRGVLEVLLVGAALVVLEDSCVDDSLLVVGVEDVAGAVEDSCGGEELHVQTDQHNILEK